MMNHGTGRPAVRSTGQLTMSHWRWAVAAAAAGVIGSAVLAGCGQETLAAQRESAASASATASAAAASGNASCTALMPVVEHAVGVLQQLDRGAATGAEAKRLLRPDQAEIGKLVHTTSDTALQEDLAQASDAFAAFGTVMTDRSTPAYRDTFTNLAGALTALQRVCSVGNPDFASGTHGWAAINGNTALSRSATAHAGRWSLQVTNAGKSPAAAGFTDSPPWVSTTLKGSEQIGLWARAVTGTPTLTLQVRELSGSTVVGSQQVTMKLDSTFRFVDLTYRVLRPGNSKLSVTVSAAGLAPGGAFLADGITIVRD
jgi:hypothetical protein